MIASFVLVGSSPLLTPKHILWKSHHICVTRCPTDTLLLRRFIDVFCSHWMLSKSRKGKLAVFIRLLQPAGTLNVARPSQVSNRLSSEYIGS